MRRSRRGFIVITSAAAVLLASGPGFAAPEGHGAARSGLPTRVQRISVFQGRIDRGVGAALGAATTISGKVTAAAGGAPVRARVYVFRGSTLKYVAASNASTGRYVVGGLPRAKNAYRVCVLGIGASGGTSTTGYQSQCYPSVTWTPASTNPKPNPDAQQVVVSKGHNATGINVALPTAGGIGGTILDPSNAPVPGVAVSLLDRDTNVTYAATTNSAGNYRKVGLPPAADGYTVCFSALPVATGTGLLSQCWQHLAWVGTGRLPATATSVPVTAGALTSGIGANLATAGAISGQVTDSSTAAPLRGVSVAVYNAGGGKITQAVTDSSGDYTLRDLRPSTTDQVCAMPHQLTAAKSYRGQCYQGHAWNGTTRPASDQTTPVSVTLGGTTTGIDFPLVAHTLTLGGIAGKVTGTGGVAVPHALVALFDSSGNVLAEVLTNKTGQYGFANVGAADSYRVCVQAPVSGRDPSALPGGWAPACYPKVRWEGAPTIPPGAAESFPLTPGQHRKSINVVLGPGGGISGKVTTSGTTPTGIGRVAVYLYDPASRLLAKTFTRASGLYELTGLAAYKSTKTIDGSPGSSGLGSYVICFDARHGTTSPAGYEPQCYKAIPWAGPAYTNPVEPPPGLGGLYTPPKKQQPIFPK